MRCASGGLGPPRKTRENCSRVGPGASLSATSRPRMPVRPRSRPGTAALGAAQSLRRSDGRASAKSVSPRRLLNRRRAVRIDHPPDSGRSAMCVTSSNGELETSSCPEKGRSEAPPRGAAVASAVVGLECRQPAIPSDPNRPNPPSPLWDFPKYFPRVKKLPAMGDLAPARQAGGHWYEPGTAHRKALHKSFFVAQPGDVWQGCGKD